MIRPDSKKVITVFSVIVDAKTAPFCSACQKTEYGLNPLAYTLGNGFISPRLSATSRSSRHLVDGHRGAGNWGARKTAKVRDKERFLFRIRFIDHSSEVAGPKNNPV